MTTKADTIAKADPEAVVEARRHAVRSLSAWTVSATIFSVLSFDFMGVFVPMLCLSFAPAFMNPIWMPNRSTKAIWLGALTAGFVFAFASLWRHFVYQQFPFGPLGH